jgi:hypothetical protein
MNLSHKCLKLLVNIREFFDFSYKLLLDIWSGEYLLKIHPFPLDNLPDVENLLKEIETLL